MPETAGFWSELLQPREVYHNIWCGYNEVEPAYKGLFYEENTGLERVEEFTLIGLGVFGEWQGEGDFMVQDRMYKGHKTIYVQVLYGLETAITYRMKKFSQYKLATDMLKSVGRSARQTENILTVGNIFNRAFDSDYPTGDGAALCSLGRPNYYDLAATWSNRPDTDVDLSFLGIRGMLQHYLDFNGR
jgi:hypothetical protein